MGGSSIRRRGPQSAFDPDGPFDLDGRGIDPDGAFDPVARKTNSNGDVSGAVEGATARNARKTL
jgi:hypothetical protein